jgi:hypothetical protein
MAVIAAAAAVATVVEVIGTNQVPAEVADKQRFVHLGVFCFSF